MKTTAICDMLLIADMAGDRPAIVTKAFSATAAEVCAFMPEPTVIKNVTIHPDRREAINATQRDTKYHAYPKG